jgi:predicted CXXCH cytochrome family protein
LIRSTRIPFLKILAVIILFSIPVFEISCTMVTKGLPVDSKLHCLNTGCHDDYLKKEHIHEPVKSGACMSCHKALTDIHPNEDILDFEVEGAKTCFSCHDAIKEIRESAKVLHAPFKEKVCILCHRPHSSENPKLTKKPVAELCYSCHDNFAKKVKNREYIHTPVKKGECTACHNQHGSDNHKILKKYSTERFNAPFKIENFMLCWNCHKREMVLEPLTETYTNFRNGNENLHYKHVNKSPKGRACKVCHDPHAGNQPMNLMVYSSFELTASKFHLPVKYNMTSTGGSCETGCHKIKAYDRVIPVEYK